MIVAAFLLGILPQNPVRAADGPAMTVPGQMNISAGGAFTYSVPISVPPGTAGMVPGLSLGYSSQGGDGIVGLGWSLSGLPSIERCPRTVTQDNVHGGVNYDSNDRFCLGGQRLVAISGTYGANGTEYRAEVESFAKIISYGTAGNGPAYFKIWMKSGQIIELGNTANSQVLATGNPTARSWAMNKLTDTKGNYLTVTYNSANNNARTVYGMVYPTRIDYTGNAGAGLSTYNSVRFVYTTRSDVVPAFQAGSRQQITVLLSNIQTYTGATLVSDYRLAYRAGTSTTHSRLTSVTLCDASGDCLAPASFEWQGGTGTLSYSIYQNDPAGAQNLLPGDFNGDGLTDALSLITTCPTGGVVYDATQSGTFTSANMNAQYDYDYNGSNFVVYNGKACFPYSDSVGSDIDGDGFADLAIKVIEKFWICVPTCHWANGFTTDILRNDLSGNLTQVSTNGSSGSPFLFVMPFSGFASDFDGDGRTDGFKVSNGTGYAYLSNGDGTYTADGGHSGFSGSWTFGDFDGDGCSDLLTQGTSSAISYLCNPATSQTTVTNWTGYQTVLGDYNGDGKTDILAANSSGATLYLSTGIGLLSGYGISSSSTWYNYIIVPGDWNGDGKTDIALVSQSGGQHLIYLSTSTGFVQALSITNAASGTITPVTSDWNNDGATDLWLRGSIGSADYNFSYTPELMTSVSNGVGATVTITYDRLNKNGSFYTKGRGATYPIQDVDGAIYAVSRIDSSNGIGGTYSSTYAYAGAKKDLHGRGSLGFSQITATDLQTNIVDTTNYRTDFPFTGQVSSETRTHGSVTLSSITNTYADTSEGNGTDGVARHYVTLTQSVVVRNDLDGSAFPTVTTNYTYDTYGNALTIPQSLSDGSSRTATNTYTNDTTNWILGQLASANVESVVGTSDLTRHFSFAHDAASGVLTQQIVEPNTQALKLQADIGYDGFGNRTGLTLSGTGITTRTSSIGYGTRGQFATSTTNALSQGQSLAYNSNFGEPTGQTDLNGLTTNWAYDTFGRQTQVTQPDGNKAAISYSYCSGVNGGTASCPTYGAYLVQTTPENSSGTQNGAVTIAYFDALGRSIAVDTQGFDGSWIRTASQYDANGRVSQTSRPYFTSGGTAKWTAYTYDDLGRVTQATMPDSSHANFAFHGLSTSSTNALSQTTTSVQNAQGRVASVTDALNHATAYAYDAFGDLTSVTDSAGNVISNTYDLRGRKTASSDPDMGSWSYVYDVLSELTSQTDAKSQTTNLTYDLLGRVTQSTDATQTSGWTYDTATKGVGALASTTTNGGYSRTHSYDSLSRPSGATLTIDSTNYSYGATYNSDGRVDTISYPSGLVLKYVYNSYGYLSQVKDNASGTAYWTANSADAEMHITAQTYGNGAQETESFDPNTGFVQQILAGTSNSIANFHYSWDAIGNLTNRADTYQGFTENFCYDALNRLTDSAMGSSCTAGTNHKTLAYDALGDIISKSDIGTYSYPATGQAHPHAVSSITGTVNGVTNPTFSYDANGNMTSDAGRGITYNAFNMAAQITQGTTTIAFTYDSGHQRIKQAISGGSSNTTYYLNAMGGSSEKFVAGSTTTWHDYIYAAGALAAERFCTGAAPCTSGATMLYAVDDHLRSVSSVTDGSGAVTERDGYDAWGKRRNANGTDNTACSLTSAVGRGFTGHEMMDSVCLINMNARIYDPSLGRFMSADTIVPDPLDGQSFNRYSYVNNNPLNATDPTGHACSESDSACHHPVHPWPCWGCSGQGWLSSPDGDGSMVSAASLGFQSYTLTDPATGNVLDSFTGRMNELPMHLNAIAYNNAINGKVTHVEFEMAGLSGVTFDYGIAGVGLTENGVTSWSFGPGNVSIGTNGTRLAAVGDFPPAPPGYDPNTWRQDQWENGKWRLTAPNGNRYTIHPEDKGHWRHWDKQDSDGNDDGTWPPNSKKPWPGQKKPPYGNQSPTDPSDNAPGWTPSPFSPCMVAGPGDCSRGNYFVPGRSPGGIPNIPYEPALSPDLVPVPG